MKIKLGLVLLMILAITFASGCVDDETAPTGDDRTVEQTSIQDLLENRGKYDGAEVAIKGTIISQCMRGCKFNVNDGTGVIFVQMLGEAWERPLPQSIGKTVELRGTFYQNPRPHIIVMRPEQVRVR
jgi:uncharacterized protein YdeI (BOF family)